MKKKRSQARQDLRDMAELMAILFVCGVVLYYFVIPYVLIPFGAQ